MNAHHRNELMYDTEDLHANEKQILYNCLSVIKNSSHIYEAGAINGINFYYRRSRDGTVSFKKVILSKTLLDKPAWYFLVFFCFFLTRIAFKLFSFYWGDDVLPFPLWAWTFIETTWASERLPWRPPSTGPVWNSMSLTPDMSWLRGFHGSIRSHSTYLCHFVPMLQKRVSRLYRQFPCISETHVMNFGTMCVCVASGKRVEYGNGKHSRKVFRPPAACSSHVLYLGQHPSLVSQCVTEIHNISRCQLRWTRWNGDVESCQAFNLLYNIIQPYSGQFLQGPQRGT